MKDFSGKFAVITGGGTGMGRELARQLVAEGCNVAICDVSVDNMAQTRALCEAEGTQGTRVATFRADVSEEDQMLSFRDAVKKDLETDHIHLLFNNAGIGGGGSLVDGDRAAWEKTFKVCWNGVYYGVVSFLPMLRAAEEARIVNTSSVNGFWASIGPLRPHTAYSAAKFAVKGFTEALINDLRLTAPHVTCSVVMPGHIGTPIVANSRKILSGSNDIVMSEAELDQARRVLRTMGVEDPSALSKEDIVKLIENQAQSFEQNAPTTAADAARVILDGVRAGKWRILVGEDAHVIDQMVRENPEQAYEPAFYQEFLNRSGWAI